ncbi:MAG: hypothetical protein J6S98_04395, partial [Lentisphaeria bacterium]|nr:hypothetical protein [Lentisphaeria bacterium]
CTSNGISSGFFLFNGGDLDTSGFMQAKLSGCLDLFEFFTFSRKTPVELHQRRIILFPESNI